MIVLGVGHILPNSPNVGLEVPSGFEPPVLLPCLEPASGVGQADPMGQHEEPLPSMRGADSRRAEQAPLRIEPEVGQSPEKVGESHPNEAWDVLHEDESGSHFTNDPDELFSEVPFVAEPTALSCNGPWLTWDPSRDEIHSTSPSRTVERGKVIPDRRLIQDLVLHPRHESGRRTGFPLNVSHGSYSVSEGELERKGNASVTGAEVQGV